ncbi:MAG: metallophosphoesterase [Chloroflexi bacterium]|nr:metallophosphoesterase [Chloroflexota bacterium]MCL5276071.1 metallophosphoesterase [Chloroflexota bacterium]
MSQPSDRPQHKVSRRRFLRLAAAGGVAVAVPGVLGAYGLVFEPHRLTVERIDIRSRRIPPALDGLTVGVLSDFHRSTWISQAYIAQAAQQLMSMRPDVVTLTGDFVMSQWLAESAGAALRDVAAAPLGAFAVLGNHDHWNDAAAVTRGLETGFAGAGIQILFNERRILSVRGTPLHVVGVDDVWEQKADLSTALRGLPRDAPAILLAHEPDFADRAAAAHPFILQVSGHSHGGQVRLPLVGALRLPWLGSKYPIGLQRVQDSAMLVYTTRGIGMVQPAVRFGCPPEVTMLKLRSA